MTGVGSGNGLSMCVHCHKRIRESRNYAGRIVWRHDDGGSMYCQITIAEPVKEDHQ